MPRRGKGGPRSGNPGTAYTNRTDLAADTQPVAVPTGQPYGEAGRQQAAMSQIGVPDLQGMLQSMPGLTDPSQRPEEPLTAGMPTGSGPGPMPGPPGKSAAGLLRSMLSVSPDPELWALLEEAQRSESMKLASSARAMMPASPRTNPTGFNAGSVIGSGLAGAPVGQNSGRQAALEQDRLNGVDTDT